jgi:RNA polymerase sigma-70 factor, ECF subfamily
MIQLSTSEMPEPSITDSEVVRRVLAGETELFEILMRRYNQRLYRTARAILGDDAEAEQVMQDAHFQAFTHLAQFAERAKFSTWLTKIAVHEAFSRLRRRLRFVDFESFAESGRGKTMLISADRTPEQKALDCELKNLLESAVERLPEHYRSVLVMRDVEEMDTSETSECLGISEETVKIRLHRARALMRKQLYARAGVTRQELFSFHKIRCDRVVAAVYERIKSYLQLTVGV